MTGAPFDRYSETFFEELHRGVDFDLTAKGYEEYYYDCLPEDREAPVLDVGCGAGHFLKFLETKGYRRAEGLDLSPQQVEEARRHVACPVHVGEAAKFLAERPGHYAAITINDVLEHVPKDRAVPFLATLRNGLRPGGVLVVNVPSAAGLTTAYVRYNDFTHELVFTELSLQQVLLMAGFRSVRFVPERWPLKFTPRHLAYRLVRWVWYRLLKLIYFVEMPGGRLPSHWQVRLVAVAAP
ncbi:MAG: class I SAM-dependent methyltransferase [Nitrospirota bacterium]